LLSLLCCAAVKQYIRLSQGSKHNNVVDEMFLLRPHDGNRKSFMVCTV
jgi:hypothetical protein